MSKHEVPQFHDDDFNMFNALFRYYASLKDPGEGPVYTYLSNWDAEMMYGCNCDHGIFGPDCSLRSCPTGDDPLTESVVDNPPDSAPR